jgi:hypothetical protein
MMNKYLSLLILLLGSAVLPLSAQEHYSCGTTGELAAELIPHLLKNKIRAARHPAAFRSTQYVPIKFHLVARTDGSGRVSEHKLLDQICLLNEIFSALNVQFYIRNGFNYINNTAVFNDPLATQNTIMTFERDRNAINLFIVGNSDSGDGLGVVLGFYNPRYDHIVVDKSVIVNVGGTAKALAHEIGHFFTLLHTHNGWDSEPWDETIGNPAPGIAPDGVTTTEKMDGSNCDRAGDFLCDTPPDYNGFGWPTCDYDGGARDPDGVLIDPNENNIMSYFLANSCSPQDFYFSEEQKQIMLASLSSTQRAYLRNSYSPQPLTESVELITPINGQNAPGGTGMVRLEWTPVENATNYLVEIGRVATFSISPIRLFVEENFVDVPGLDIGRRFYWRVRPVNASFTCEDLSSETTSFTVSSSSTAVNDLPFLNSWSLSPNPVKESNELQLFLDTKTGFEAELNLFGITGQRVRSLGRTRFNTGENRMSIPTGNLTPGVYLLSVASEEGRLNQRIVIME